MSIPKRAQRGQPRQACVSTLIFGLVLGFSGACQPGEAPSPAPDLGLRPAVSVRELMTAMVVPSADVLWSSAELIATEDGFEVKEIETDEQWEELRRSATIMAEAANLILIEGRAMAPPGATSSTPGVELEPDEIAALVLENPDAWLEASHSLQDSAKVYLDAIAARDSQALGDAGDVLNSACEKCHVRFWYPPQESPP